MSDVMAIGDGENDVALLAAAGVRCAMGNGSEALKERCVLSLRWCRPARACMRASWTCLAHLLTPCALSAPTTCWAPTMRREDGRSPLRWPCTPSRGWRAFRRALASARSICKWQSTRATRAGSCLRPLRARVPGGPRAADARVRRRRERACPRRQRGSVRRNSDGCVDRAPTPSSRLGRRTASKDVSDCVLAHLRYHEQNRTAPWPGVSRRLSLRMCGALSMTLHGAWSLPLAAMPAMLE